MGIHNFQPTKFVKGKYLTRKQLFTQRVNGKILNSQIIYFCQYYYTDKLHTLLTACMVLKLPTLSCLKLVIVHAHGKYCGLAFQPTHYGKGPIHLKQAQIIWKGVVKKRLPMMAKVKTHEYYYLFLIFYYNYYFFGGGADGLVCYFFCIYPANHIY